MILIASASVAADLLTMDLEDGRILSVPLAYYWRLAQATDAQRQRFEILPNGRGIHWPDIDEDVSIRGALIGMPAKPPGKRATMTLDRAAERLGIAPRTVRQTISRMEGEGLRVGESQGRYRVLSEEDLDRLVRWRQYPPGRPRRKRE